MAAPATHTPFFYWSGGYYELYNVTASATIHRGDILVLTTNALVQSIALPGSNSTGTASGGNLPIYCIAEEDFTANASGQDTNDIQRTQCLCKVIDDTMHIETRGYNAVSTDCEQQDFALGTAYQFQRWRDTSASIWWYEVITTTTNGELKCIARSPNSALADAYGINYFKPILSATVRALA